MYRRNQFRLKSHKEHRFKPVLSFKTDHRKFLITKHLKSPLPKFPLSAQDRKERREDLEVFTY